MQETAKQLITWYLKNKRDLPWRNTRDPYRIWLSEIMLQQTRVEQGLPYYLKFTNTFKTVEDLAKADEETVLKLWQGLGYYSRARNLHTTAKYVTHELNGEFPKTYKELLQLKGVGEYTASAIASFCFKEPKAVVDGNVYRVLSRLFSIDTPINSSEGQKIFAELAQSLISHEEPDSYNQAIMEFGARQCKPKNPDCESCIFNSSCIALKNKKVSELPVKLKKIKVKKRYFNYIVPITADRKTTLQKRPDKGVWANLYEFPLIETAKESTITDVVEQQEFQLQFSEYSDLNLFNSKTIVHKLSHQHIYTKFWILETDQLLDNSIAIADLESYPVSVLVANFIDQFSF